MWGKNETQNPAAAPKPAASVQPEPGVAAPPTPSVPSVMAETAAFGRPGQSVIGKSVVTKAEITASEDLRVDGDLEGSIKVPEYTVTIGPSGNVKANIIARNITVHGALHGNLQASEKIEIRKTGSLLGDVTTAGITIEDGAYFKGSIDILRPEPKSARPEQRQEQKPPRPETKDLHAVAAASPATGARPAVSPPR